MSERSNRNGDKFAQPIRRQESQDWFQRKITNLDRQARNIAEQMRGVFSGYMMTPATVLAGEVVAARHQHGEAFYDEAYRIATLAFEGGNGDLWQMHAGAVTSSEGKRREGGRFSPEARNVFVLIVLLILAAMLLGACAPPAGATFKTETPTAASTIATATEMPDVVPTIATAATATEMPAVVPTIATAATATEMPAVVPTIATAATATEMPAVVPTKAATKEPIASVPEYAADFAEGGYCGMETEPGSQHVIFDETSLKYAPTSDGILHNGIRIFSWFNNVTYFGKDGQYHTGIVLNNTCAVGGVNDGRFTSALTDGSHVTPNSACPGMPYFQGQNRDLLKVMPGNYHILKAFFGPGHDANKDLVYGSIFSGTSTPADTISIPGIGDNILPITVFRNADPPAQ